jgi:Concanavalin A-like lectin/glucanases superfamily
MRRSIHLIAGVALLLLISGAGVQAQPFTAWLLSTPGYPTSNGYVQVPHSAALNPTGSFTFEAWVSVTNSTTGEDCRSIAGKGYTAAWWVGVCNVSGQPTLRTYLKGGSSARNGGIVPRNVLTHIAVTFDGAKRRHYINGELAAEFNETGPLTTSTSPLRIGSDVSWEHSPTGIIDEVRLWSVARTITEIRDSLNERVTTSLPGLVAVWPLDANANDIIGPHDGSLTGTGVSYFTSAVTSSCGASTATTLCLNDRFIVRSFWRTNPVPGSPTDGQAQVAGCPNEGSGLFWFFSSTNWEIMVKVLNGCGLNNRWWVFSAATTNVFYRLEVTDVTSGETKIYFNYPGLPAPAVTDTNALAVCF